MISLNRHQHDLLGYLKLYVAESGGMAPSYDEMREAVGLASKSVINRLIVALEECGLIRRLPNRARMIEIIRHNPLQTVSASELAAELECRGWHCLPPLRSGTSTARPGLNLPEPSKPMGGSGPSDVPYFHASEMNSRPKSEFVNSLRTVCFSGVEIELGAHNYDVAICEQCAARMHE